MPRVFDGRLSPGQPNPETHMTDQTPSLDERVHAVDRAAPTVWIDGHPQLEAIAAAVSEQCEHHDSGLVVDDPRNIAVAALGAALAMLPPPTPPALTPCTCRQPVHDREHAQSVTGCPWCAARQEATR